MMLLHTHDAARSTVVPLERRGLEACFNEVWEYVSLDEILRDWIHIEKHLGRRRGFWQFLLRGWREDGLIPAA
jgi:hypothetical protein